MSNSPLESRKARQYTIHCLKCDRPIPPNSNICPQCGTAIAPGTVKISAPLKPCPQPTQTLGPATTSSLFSPSASVLLRFLPLGQTLSYPMRKPLVLGRTFDVDVEKALNLTEYGGEQHGISRRHCQLERRGTKLLLTDLDSTNGTFLNGERLLPHKEHKVAHGDRLILGTMHILVLFNTGH